MAVTDFRVEVSPMGAAAPEDIEATGLLKLNDDQQRQLDQGRRLLERAAEILEVLEIVAMGPGAASFRAIEVLDYIRHGNAGLTEVVSE
jgi:hypothetical protein